MTKLYSVSGVDYKYCDVNKNLWQGFLLLEDDGWFEGIIVDSDDSYTDDRFIFGIYHLDKVMELYNIISFDISAPLIFHLTNSFNGYEGQIEMIDLFENIPYGISCVNVSDSLVSRESVKLEILKLQSKIQSYKDNIIDSEGRSFYSNLINMRESLSQTILNNYESNKIRKILVKEKNKNDRY